MKFYLKTIYSVVVDYVFPLDFTFSYAARNAFFCPLILNTFVVGVLSIVLPMVVGDWNAGSVNWRHTIYSSVQYNIVLCYVSYGDGTRARRNAREFRWFMENTTREASVFFFYMYVYYTHTYKWVIYKIISCITSIIIYSGLCTIILFVLIFGSSSHAIPIECNTAAISRCVPYRLIPLTL